MKKKSLSVEMDYYIEKAVTRYCIENRISIDQFMEDAVLDRLEAGEYGERGSAEYDGEPGAGYPENMIFETEGDFYKKKH